MTPQDWRALRLFFTGVAVVLGLFAAILTAIEIAENDKHERSVGWFSRKWIAIENSGWTSLLERVVRWALSEKVRLIGYVRAMLHAPSSLRLLGLLWTLPYLLTCVACLFGRKPWETYFRFLTLVMSPSLLLVTVGIWFGSEKRFAIVRAHFNYLRSSLRFAVYGLIALIAMAWLLLSPIVGALLSVSLNILSFRLGLGQTIFTSLSYLFFLIRYVFPLIYATLAIYLISGATYRLTAIINILLAIVASVIITSTAISIGVLCRPDFNAGAREIIQLHLSNILFDTLSIIATFTSLSWARNGKVLKKVPLVIILNTALGILFAGFSLYFGLIRTRDSLPLSMIGQVLVGRSPDGFAWEFGPYFWLMHSTFLPTLLFLCLVLVCWAGKAMLVPALFFFGKARTHNNPLKLTAAVLAVFVALFAVLSFACATAEGYSTERTKADSPRASIEDACRATREGL
jgi:hypothetical protein